MSFDFSFTLQGKAIFNAEFRQQQQAAYYDGTRFVQTTGNGARADMTTVGTMGAAVAINDISTLGTFATVTQDLQRFKQS